MNLRVPVVFAIVPLLWAASTVPSGGGQISRPILGDSYMSAAAGATVVTTVGAAIAAAEDKRIPHRLFEERGVARRTANVAYRLTRWVLFDVPQESFLVVLNHEVFGHGARLRESFDGSIGYQFDAPVPYGNGGGVTFFDFDREPTPTELLAVTTGGMEASGVAASLIADHAFRWAAIDPREAIRYLGFELDAFSYIQSTGDRPEEPGHDVSDFLQTYNEAAQQQRAPGVTARTLRHEALASLANPMLAFAVAGIARYIWNGAVDTSIPAFHIRTVRYLPLARYRLTPFGTEFVVSNELAGRSTATLIDLRVGRAPGVVPWGVTVRRQPIVEWHSYTLGLWAHAWRQPSSIGTEGTEGDVSSLRFGAALLVTAERAVPAASVFQHPLSLVVETGFKSAGFVPGEPLAQGFVLRGGVAIGSAR